MIRVVNLPANVMSREVFRREHHQQLPSIWTIYVAMPYLVVSTIKAAVCSQHHLSVAVETPPRCTSHKGH